MVGKKDEMRQKSNQILGKQASASFERKSETLTLPRTTTNNATIPSKKRQIARNGQERIRLNQR